MVLKVNRFMHSKIFMTSIIIIVGIIIYAYALPYFSPYSDPMRWNQAPMDSPPSSKYIFGTTTLGQDLFWTCSFALRNSISFGVITSIISTVIALFVGIASAYLRGKLSAILAIFIDCFCVLPALSILVLISALWTGGTFMANFALILSIFGWSWSARTVRSMILSLRERTFTYTARFSGYKILDSVIYEYLPYIFGIILVSALNVMLWAIGMETTLAIFGLTSLGVPSIGTIIFWAMSYQALVRGIWWWISFPIALLIIFIVALYLAAREIYMRRVGG